MPERTVVKLVIALILCILLIVFALQNFSQECRLKIFFWTIGTWPVSVVIFVSILLGVLIAVCEVLPHVLKLRRRAQSAEEALARLKAARGAAPATEARPWGGERGKGHA